MASRKGSKNFTIKQNTKPEPKVQNKTKVKELSNQIWFNLSDHKWMSSVKMKDYTNFIQNTEMGLSNLYSILSIIIPKVTNEWHAITKNPWQYTHCHQVADEKIELVRKIYKEIYKIELDESLSLWQLGFTQGVRLICFYDTYKNSLVPIFIDHNHLIHPSQKYNQSDTDNYKYCIICSHERN